MRGSASFRTIVALLASIAVFGVAHGSDELTIFLLDISGSMVDDCFDSATSQYEEGKITRLEQAVDYLDKRLEAIEYGTVALMLFAGRSDKSPAVQPPLHDVDQHPTRSSQDGPIRDTYILDLGQINPEEGHEGFHTLSDRDELRRFLTGGAFTYRAAPDDENEEGDGILVSDWPGLAEVLRSCRLIHVGDDEDEREEAYKSADYWYGRCTAIFDSMAEALQLAQDPSLGPFESVNLFVLTDWGRIEGCDGREREDIEELLEDFCEKASEQFQGLSIKLFMWEDPPNELKIDPSSIPPCVELDEEKIDTPTYFIYPDRTRYQFDPDSYNAWYDRGMAISECAFAHVDHYDPVTQTKITNASVEARIKLSLVNQNGQLEGIALAQGEGTSLPPEPIRANVPWTLAIALDTQQVRATIRSTGLLEGSLFGRLEMDAIPYDTETRISEIPKGMIQVPYQRPNVDVRMGNDGHELTFDLQPNDAFRDARNEEQELHITYDAARFDLLVNGTSPDGNMISIGPGGTTVRLVPRPELPPAKYDGAVVFEHLGSAESLVDEKERFDTAYTLHVVGFNTEKLVFYKNLWQPPNITGPFSIAEEFSIVGIDPSLLSVALENIALPGINTIPDLSCTANPNGGTCTLQLTFDPVERIGDVWDPDVNRSVRFFLNPTVRIDNALVVFENGSGSLPIQFTYVQKIIEFTITKLHPGACAEADPETPLVDIDLELASGLEPDSQDARVRVREIRDTRTNEPHVFQLLPGGGLSPVGEDGIILTAGTTTRFVTPPEGQPKGGSQDCYEGTLVLEPVAEDALLRDPGGDVHETYEENYAFTRRQPPPLIVYVSPALEESPAFVFGNAFLENPANSKQVVLLGDGSEAPTRGAIVIEAINVALRDSAGEPVRQIPGRQLTIDSIGPPFARDKGPLRLLLDGEILRLAEPLEMGSLTGTLVLNYDPPSDATPPETLTMFGYGGHQYPSLEIDFEVDLAYIHVDVNVSPELTIPAKTLVAEQEFTITTKHHSVLGETWAELTQTGEHFDITYVDDQDTRIRTWTLVLRSDCEDVPLGESLGTLSFRVESLLNAIIRTNGAITASHDFRINRVASVELEWPPEEPRRTGQMGGMEIDVWKRGDLIALLHVIPGDDAACLDPSAFPLDVSYGDTADLQMCLVPSSGATDCLEELSTSQDTYAVRIRDDAPRGREIEGYIEVEVKAGQPIVLIGATSVRYHVFSEWRLMETLHGVSMGVLFAGLLPFVGAIGFIVFGVLVALVQQALGYPTGDAPWEVIAGLYKGKKKKPWALPATVIAATVAVIGLTTLIVFAQWTC